MKGFIDKYIPLIFWTAVIAALTLGAWMIVTNREDVVESDLPQPDNGTTNDLPSDILIDRPLIQEVSADGSVNWTLYMENVTSRDGGVMELAEPRARYKFESGEELEITGETGSYDEDAGFLVLTGGVVGSALEAGFSFTVGEVEWDNPTATLRAYDGVEITREGLKFTGEELILSLADEFASMEVKGGEPGIVISSKPE